MTRKTKKKSTQKLSFTLFGHFPPELRNQIWIFSLPSPRIVALEQIRQPVLTAAQHSGNAVSSSRENSHTISISQIYDQESVFVYKSQSCVAAIYAVCQESRAIFKQSYTKLFITENSPGTWIDCRWDALYLPFECCQRDSHFYENFQQDIKQIKILAVGGIWSEDEDESRLFTFGSMDYILTVLGEFGNLDWLMLIDAQHKQDRTTHLGMIMGESARECGEDCGKWLRSWIDPADLIKPFLWPRFEVGVFVNIPDDSGQWQDRHWRVVQSWKEMCKSFLGVRRRFGRLIYRLR